MSRLFTRPSRLLAAGLLGATLGLGGLAAPAHAETGGNTMQVDGRVLPDGRLEVTETITFAGELPRQFEQRFALTEDTLDRAHYSFDVDSVTAKAGGTDLGLTITTQDEAKTVAVNTSGAKGPVTISYVVTGAAREAAPVAGEPARTEVTWNVLQGLDVPLSQVSGGIDTPGAISFVNCESGPVQRLSPCTTFGGGTHGSPQPSFTDGPRAAGEVITLDFAVPGSVVAPNARIEHKWSLDRAFSVNRNTLLASLLPLLLGGALLFWLHRRAGRDLEGHQITPVAEFTPVGPGESSFTVLHDVRPGHVGTVADERVDPIDVTATLLDLAVRGWLRIVELPRDGAHKALDWTFERTAGGEGDLRPFELHLLDAVAPAEGPAAAVSTISEAVTPVVERVQHELYADVVQRGWFDRSPEQTRSRWTMLGWATLVLAIIATIGLVTFTTFGLVGFALTALALGALLIAQEMPRRTTHGSALLAGLSALASQLRTQPTAQLPTGRELAELSRILPYAVVLGGRERWVDALVAADDDDTPDGDDLDWYRAPGDWHLRDLPDSLNAFIVSVQGQLFGR
ncbi:MAG: DUF2207 domain-containing protein [Luteococcus sp.]|uniref:DUF2207 family protein n=1 Tax=Luteococcus sp. TaxID=1969402 RepID=UPI00264725C3|nr:DUF2207 domain-containing protein [Luteococcus sp.]MDN5563211.1 DUF2207 domain-containing protein [Luteococcus sp.]